MNAPSEADLVRLGEAVETARSEYALLGRQRRQMALDHMLALALLAHVGDERMVLAYHAFDDSWVVPEDTPTSFEDSVDAYNGEVEVIEVVVVRRTRRGDK